MNSRIERLSDYPFQRLARLKAGVPPPSHLKTVDLSLGEPKHPTPPFIQEALVASLKSIQTYPLTRGLRELRESAALWLVRRYGLPASAIDPETQLIPCNGSREALFSIALATIDSRPGKEKAVAILPNPFYQIYEGAALMAGAEVTFVNAKEENGFLPDYAGVPEEILRRTHLLYVCSPSNPTGAVADIRYFQRLIEMAQRYGFVIASDECYSEIYDALPPPGLLEAAWTMGNTDLRHCVIFQSLSKRSNMPGARSGFVAGDAAILKDYMKLRIYSGGATPYFIQAAAAAAWAEENHVEENRKLYRTKMERFLDILSPVLKVRRPQAGFYLWMAAGNGEAFSRELLREQNVIVLPGAYLGRESHGENPGSGYVRIALVSSPEECEDAAHRIRKFAAEHRDMAGSEGFKT